MQASTARAHKALVHALNNLFFMLKTPFLLALLYQKAFQKAERVFPK